MGPITNPMFTDQVQFRIFCKMVQGCLALKQDLTTYDAQELFIHIPYKVLVESVVVSKVNGMNIADVVKERAKLVNEL
jgi:hypothetical protein